MTLLDKLSLGWKFMLAPLLGIVLTLLLAGLFVSATARQEQSLFAIQEDILASTQVLSRLATRLATNHARVYELLKLATEGGDEGLLYDTGKPLLHEVHSIEADTRQATRGITPSTDLLLAAITAYRQQVITAVEMASVDLNLAHKFMTNATTRFNGANSQFLGLGEVMQQSLETQLVDYQRERQQTLRQFSVLLLLVLLAVLVISLLLSRLLSRDLRQSIKVLSGLTASGEIQATKSEVAQLAQVIEYVKHSHQRLLEAQNRLSIIVDNAVDAIITIDEKGAMEQFNAAAETIFGYTSSEVLGRNVAMLMPAHHSKQHDAFLAAYLATGKAHILGKTRELEGRRKDGSIFPIDLGVNELWIEGQRKFTGLIRDTSRRVASERELASYREGLEVKVKERTAALERSNRELESYSYSIAHDLRTPLRSIISFSQILQDETMHKLNAGEIEDFERIVTASKHMAELIDDILELGRISRTDVRHAEVDLSALAKAAVERLCVAGEDHDIDWVIHEGLMAVGDKKLLASLLDNLLGNACKYSSGNTHAHIEFGSIVVDEGGKQIPAYFVRDNGVGFDMQYADKLFKPFQRLHNDADFEGTGIGLATAQRIAERHGGRVWAEAVVDEGATFYFTLPTF